MIRPMLAQAADGVPVGGWTFEIKWDGVRCIARVRKGKVTLQSRSGKSDYERRFAAVAEQLAALPDCVVDGELVHFDEAGGTFGLPAGMGATAGSFIVFDLLELEGASTRGLAIEDRRDLLRDLLEGASTPNVSVSPVFEDGAQLLAWVAARGYEGIVAKKDGSRYLDGHRGHVWLKVKPRCEQEFVVMGWTEGKGSRAGHIGGLVVGYYEGGFMVYAGRVGARMADETELRKRLKAAKVLPPARLKRLEPNASWVMPTVVIQVAFQNWTLDERLWHPVMKGIRTDKKPREVVRET